MLKRFSLFSQLFSILIAKSRHIYLSRTLLVLGLVFLIGESSISAVANSTLASEFSVASFQPATGMQCAELGWLYCSDEDGGFNSKWSREEITHLFVNGICNSPEAHRTSLMRIEKKYRGLEGSLINPDLKLAGIYNLSQGCVLDGAEMWDLKRNINFPVVHSLAAEIINLMQIHDGDENFRLTIIAHSEGALIVSNALELIQRDPDRHELGDIKKHIHVISVGGAAHEFPTQMATYSHFVNVGFDANDGKEEVDLVAFWFGVWKTDLPKTVNYISDVHINKCDISFFSIRFHDFCLYNEFLDLNGPTIQPTSFVSGRVLIPSPDGPMPSSNALVVARVNGTYSATIANRGGEFLLKSPVQGEAEITAINYGAYGTIEHTFVETPSRAPDIILDGVDQVGLVQLDTVLVIDSSGSMSRNDPSRIRVAAGKTYVYTAQLTDGIGLVDFSTSIEQQAAVQPVILNRIDLINKLHQIRDGGETNISLALQRACDLLIASSSNHEYKAAIFLTDGQHTGGTPYNNSHTCFSSEGRSWPIYTIGLGGDYDEQFLQQIAVDTGGAFSHISTIVSLPCQFQIIRSNITGESRECNPPERLAPNELVTKDSFVPDNLAQVSFSTSWQEGDIRMTIRSPFGRVIDRTTNSGDVIRDNSQSYEVITILNPDAGSWQVEILGAEVGVSGEDFVFTQEKIPEPIKPDLHIISNLPSRIFGIDHPFTQQLEIRNNSPLPATNVVFSQSIPDEVEFSSIEASGGSCSHGLSGVECTFASLGAGQSIFIEVKLIPRALGTFSLSPQVLSSETDSNSSDNTILDHFFVDITPQRLYPTHEITLVDTLEWPSFQFQHISGVEWYRIWVGTSDYQSVALDEWYPADDTSARQGICTGNVCSVPVDLWLKNGNYEWWMTYWTPDLPDFNNNWNKISFEVDVAFPNQTRYLFPESQEYEEQPLVLEWERDNNTLWYRVILQNSDGTNTVMDEWLPSMNVCDSELTCSTNIPALENGDYTWEMEAWGPGGLLKAESNAAQTFSINVVIPPAALPGNLTNDPRQGRPLIIWDDDPNTLWVQLWIGGAGNGKSHNVWYERSGPNNAFTCAEGLCVVEPNIDWPTATYKVWMRAWGPGGMSEWVQGPDLVLPNTPPAHPLGLFATGIDTNAPTFTWYGTDNATWYNLWITKKDGSWGYSQWKLGYDLSQDCGNATGQCEWVVPDIAGVLMQEQFLFRVRAWGPGGISPYTCTQAFVDEILAYFSQLVPPAPAHLDLSGDKLIDLSDYSMCAATFAG